MLETSTDILPSEYVGKVVTLRNAKYEGTVISGRCTSIKIALVDGAQIVSAVSIEGTGSHDIAYTNAYEWQWYIESALSF